MSYNITNCYQLISYILSNKLNNNFIIHKSNKTKNFLVLMFSTKIGQNIFKTIVFLFIFIKKCKLL